MISVVVPQLHSGARPPGKQCFCTMVGRWVRDTPLWPFWPPGFFLSLAPSFPDAASDRALSFFLYTFCLFHSSESADGGEFSFS